MKETIYYLYQKPEHTSLIQFHICGITHPDKHYSIVRNRSEVACIEYVAQGTGVIAADDFSYTVSAGDSYFLQPGQNQYYYADEDEPWEKYFVNLSGELLEKLIDSYGLRGQIYYPKLNLKQELLELIQLAKEFDDDHTERFIGIINRMFFKMHFAGKQIERVEPIVGTIREFLDRKAVGEFCLQELCDAVNLSQSHCIRLFKKTYRVTPYAYFLDKKLSLARHMLLNTNLSVKQIASELSFADAYYFSNLFKQKHGVSPKQYRQQQ